MAQDSRPSPAWRRLGLKLRSEIQSGDTAPDHAVPQTVEQPGKAHHGATENEQDHHGAARASGNGKLSRLGKRELHHGPAEGQDRAFKKSRKNEEQQPSSGTAEDLIVAAAKQGNGTPFSISHRDSASSTSRPKGDPNYRQKKKRRIASFLKEDSTPEHCRDNTEQSPAHQKHPDRSQISPPQSQEHSPSYNEPLAPELGMTLVVSTETDYPASPQSAAPRASKKTSGAQSKESRTTTLNSSPPQPDRRKSVTFTPDTKTNDGDSASKSFKKWVTEQKGAGAEFSPAEVAQFAPPPKSHPANDVPAPYSLNAKESQAGKPKKKLDTSLKLAPRDSSSKVNPKPKAKGKQKNHSLYLSYLSQYHDDRANWKFNKAKQNDVLASALDVTRVTDDYSEALIEYVKGLKGAGVLERLKGKCESTLKELDEVETPEDNAMDDNEARKAAKEEALQDRLQKEKKRRRTEADVEALIDHPYPDGFLRRLKRRRAEALLAALNLAAPTSQQSASTLASHHPVQRNSQKRKLRIEPSDDESSTSDSSSEESSTLEESSSEESDEEESETESSRSSDNGSDGSGNGSDSENEGKRSSSEAEDDESSDSESG